MTMNNQDDNQSMQNDENKSNDSAAGKDGATEDQTTNASGDPGRTPGAAEGDEETIDEDIREKEAEGKL